MKFLLHNKPVILVTIKDYHFRYQSIERWLDDGVVIWLDLSFTVKEDDISIPVTTPLSDIQPNVGLHIVMVKFRALVGGRG